jgi:hypothetical protein
LYGYYTTFDFRKLKRCLFAGDYNIAIQNYFSTSSQSGTVHGSDDWLRRSMATRDGPETMRIGGNSFLIIFVAALLRFAPSTYEEVKVCQVLQREAAVTL